MWNYARFTLDAYKIDFFSVSFCLNVKILCSSQLVSVNACNVGYCVSNSDSCLDLFWLVCTIISLIIVVFLFGVTYILTR